MKPDYKALDLFVILGFCIQFLISTSWLIIFNLTYQSYFDVSISYNQKHAACLLSDHNINCQKMNNTLSNNELIIIVPISNYVTNVIVSDTLVDNIVNINTNTWITWKFYLQEVYCVLMPITCLVLYYTFWTMMNRKGEREFKTYVPCFFLGSVLCPHSFAKEIDFALKPWQHVIGSLIAILNILFGIFCVLTNVKSFGISLIVIASFCQLFNFVPIVIISYYEWKKMFKYEILPQLDREMITVRSNESRNELISDDKNR
jgi:hypothetical protein